MKIGIAGLGLIGGSLAKAYKENSDTIIYGHDIDNSTTSFAKLDGVIDGILNEDTIKECDGILIALYPNAAVEYLQMIVPQMQKDAVVIDCCGTKTKICEVGFALAKEYGFMFAGGHPMAGMHKSGFTSSRANMFKGAGMIIVPPIYDDMSLFNRIKQLLEPVGFGKITISTAEKHDAMIAFTSQMAHIVSNAYIKSPTARAHKGFSAGSYKDLTRVAWLNPDMWTELFIENGDNLIKELDVMIDSLAEYKEAIADKDASRLHQLLEDGKKCKEEVDGR